MQISKKLPKKLLLHGKEISYRHQLGQLNETFAPFFNVDFSRYCIF